MLRSAKRHWAKSHICHCWGLCCSESLSGAPAVPFDARGMEMEDPEGGERGG